MIEPRLLTLQDLFSDRIHYEVPIYQRPYVWARDDQWIPLWEDLREVAVAHLNSDRAHAHFLGAIVIELTSAEPGRVKTFSVIDGQQRLTTLQLLIAALRTVANAHEPERDADIRRMLTNEGRHAEGPLLFKVWPSEHDRSAFELALDPEAGQSAGDEGIPGAYAYFKEQIGEWVEEDAAGVAGRLDALQDAVEGLLQVVAIQLDGSSDAQVIFETLNSRGADLTSLDLAKNSLLRQAGRDGVAVSRLHSDHWLPALGDADYWLETVRQGRYSSPRADLFLMHWLTMKMGHPARVQHLFADFRKSILRADPAPAAADIIVEMCRDAVIYRSFDNLDPESTEGRFFRRLEQMDTATLIPVALLLFRSEELSVDRRQRALRALESWLVRRMLLGSTTAHYNRLLATLLTVLNAQSNLASADDLIIETLRGYSNPTDQWPEDDLVRRRLEEQGLYGSINQARIRMVLEACEHRMADTNRTEQLALPERLSIEHALPQSWREHWHLPDGTQDEEDAASKRDEHVHLLGNLTLITSPLNSSLSNSGWGIKRGEMARRSQLLVNQRLCAHETWDEARIDSRGTELSGHIIDTWPGPSSDW